MCCPMGYPYKSTGEARFPQRTNFLLKTPMDTYQYGSRNWIEAQYANSVDDPWGLDWRPSQKYRYFRMLHALEGELQSAARPLAIVDVGCATGAFTAMLAGLNASSTCGDVVGIDIAQSAVDRAAARFPAIRFECMALSECGEKYKGSADVVTCMEVLYYLPAEERVEAVAQLRRMLKPGGLLLVSSMVASAPYFSADALSAIVSSDFKVVGSGVLYQKPFALLEKLSMKLGGKNSSKDAPFDYGKMDRWNGRFQRFLPGFTRSHAYVVGRNL